MLTLSIPGVCDLKCIINGSIATFYLLGVMFCSSTLSLETKKHVNN